ncbi:MAG: DUF1571 domain-containing protein [Reichenbachiella sp.]
MKKSRLKLSLSILAICSLLTQISIPSSAQTGYELAEKMFEAANSVSTMKFTMKKTERIEGELKTQVSSVKLSVIPYMVYTKQQVPNRGLEVLYCAGVNNNKAYINPTSFPWITLKLDPMGSLMRNGQHHTALNAGYDLVMSILEFIVNKYGEESKTMISQLDSVQFGGIDCYAIELKNPYFQFIDYKVKEGETLTSIEDSLKLSGYMILERNGLDQDYNEIESGMTISIPNDYSPHMIIYLDKSNYLPLMMKIFDDQGMFELYEYFDVQVNLKFSKDEFSPDFEEYGF